MRYVKEDHEVVKLSYAMKELEEGVTDRDIYADRYTTPDRY